MALRYHRAMPLYVVESNLSTIEQAGHDSQGVVGTGGGREKTYLHVVVITDAELKALAVRVDEHGNKQHDRLSLPDREDWWVAIEGEKRWPGTMLPRVTSRCVVDAGGRARPAPLSTEERDALTRVKAVLPPDA